MQSKPAKSIFAKALFSMICLMLMAMFCLADLPVMHTAGVSLVGDAQALTPHQRRVNRRISRRVTRRHAIGALFYALPVGYELIYVNGVPYYYADETYFVEEDQDGTTVYVVVEDPE